MGTPAAVMGDRITGTCAIHLIPGAMGAPQPGPPMPFSAPLLTGLATKVMISNKPAAVAGASGYNTPPHVGLHPSDPFMVPTMQEGRITVGSTSVMIEGKPAAKTGSTCMICAGMPGQLTGTASTVMIGG